MVLDTKNRELKQYKYNFILAKKMIKPTIRGRNVFSMGYIYHCKIDWG
jgi:hypothetical protein